MGLSPAKRELSTFKSQLLRLKSEINATEDLMNSRPHAKLPVKVNLARINYHARSLSHIAEEPRSERASDSASGQLAL